MKSGLMPLEAVEGGADFVANIAFVHQTPVVVFPYFDSLEIRVCVSVLVDLVET